MHGSRYNYSLTTYKNNSTAVSIVCTKHGEFKQSPASHMKGSGCKECRKDSLSAKYKLTREQFVERANKKYQGAYDYSKVIFEDKKTPVTIGCVKHGDFSKAPSEHLNSKSGGCNLCKHPTYRKGKKAFKYNTESFIVKSKAIHGDSYDYSQTCYQHYDLPVTIVCPKHGAFNQNACVHMKGGGCKSCATDRHIINSTYTTEEFISRARLVHLERFDYSQTVYKSAQQKLTIVCRKHGVFKQVPNDHLRGVGCSRCGTSYSRPHQKVVKYLQTLGFEEGRDFLVNDRKTLLNPNTGRFLELDIYFPNRRAAIEIDGAFFHGHCSDSSKIINVEQVKSQDALKNQLCLGLGVDLLRLRDTSITQCWEEVVSLVDNFLPK